MTLSFDDIILGDNTNYTIKSIQGLSLEKLDSVWSPNARALGRLFISNYKRERTITIEGYIFGTNYRSYLDMRAKIQGLLYTQANTSKDFILTDYGETPKSYKFTAYLEEFTSNVGEGNLLDAGTFTLVLGLTDPTFYSAQDFVFGSPLKIAGWSYDTAYNFGYGDNISQINFNNKGNYPVYPKFKVNGGFRNLTIFNTTSKLQNKVCKLGLDESPLIVQDNSGSSPFLILPFTLDVDTFQVGGGEFIEIDPKTYTKATKGVDKVPIYEFVNNIEALKSEPGENIYQFNTDGNITENSSILMMINYGYNSI